VERLYATHAARLVGLARTLTGSLDSGDDLVQDVFVRIFEACKRDPGYVREPAWPLLRVTLVRLAAQRRRSIGRELRRLARVYERPTERTWDTDVDVMSALLTLPPRMRACVVLRYMEDLPVADVAGVMGTEVGTVAAQIQEARRRLRRRLSFGEASATLTSSWRNRGG
jgi:RNA polymerase sigma factor (sigma-70 family)